MWGVAGCRSGVSLEKVVSLICLGEGEILTTQQSMGVAVPDEQRVTLHTVVFSFPHHDRHTYRLQGERTI